jgi:serine phosphatase RsbU (regulator of sigma subunit)
VAHVDAVLADQAFELYRRYPPSLDLPHGPGRVIRTGERQVIPEITDELLQAQAVDDEHLALLRSLDVGSAVVLPLRASDVIVGALTLATRKAGRRFGDEDVTLAQALADQAALHLRNAQLYAERSHVARTLRVSLLPQALPDVPGVEIAARYKAAGANNEVGGDFYDVVHAEDDVWIALLGDVAGKGAEAAAVTSLARHTLRTSALHARSPAANLGTLNKALIGEASTTRFCTVLYTRICPSEGSVLFTFANGGHLAPRILRAGRPLERLEVSGTLVGAIADAHFDEVDLRLNSGDLVLMYTDGVTEVRRRGLGPEYGEAELDRILAGMAGAAPDEVVQTVLEHAIDLHGGEPRDDMALVSMRVRES